MAIEPNPNACRRLQGRIDGLDNVAIVKAALADEQKTMILALRGRRSQLVPEEGGRCTRVAVFTADGLIAAGRAPLPHVLKIDAEGFELEVLRGMKGLLRWDGLRVIGMEVHHALLAERGVPDAPREIERRLTEAGFAISWADASHIIASRK